MLRRGTRSTLAEPSTFDWVIEKLARRHDRTAFDSGKPLLDDWLKLQASQYEKKDLSRTYVIVKKGAVQVVGYYAISTHMVNYEALPQELAKGLPRIDLPVLLLGRLAVDRTVQGQGLGRELLIDALRRVQHVAEQAGVRGVEVDALDDAARSFYLKFDFMELLDNPHHLFLSLHVIRKLGLPPIASNPSGD